ncbi:TauD/TfdA dioxygenase family protein [Lichenicoccus sp.]|uniref:TauD/TfdA dioxygenase family protein n=1 Tax=Lichenicoccus sp. TaxID=2781899 RepID=UPI003D09A04A
MQSRALSPFGIEFGDIQIGRIGPHHANDLIPGLCEAIARHRVAVFRDQEADDPDLTGFLMLLGDLMFTEGEAPVDGAPSLNIVSNVGRTTPPRSVFHSDTSYVNRPPAFTAMRTVVLPEVGGATLFSDQVAAAASLRPATVTWLRDRTLLHGTIGHDGRRHEQRHPVLRRHPATGETALFLSTPERCTQLSGVDEQTSRRMVRALYQRSIRPSHLYAHRWQNRDIVVWDNRITMHRADHAGVVGDRVLHRGLVKGEVPIAA